MSQPTPARKIGQVAGIIIMVLGIIWYIVGGMLQDNKAHAYEAFAAVIVGIGIFVFCDQ